MQEIADWLKTLGMSEYAARFAENRIDFLVLRDLTDQDLKDLGVVLGDRRKMLRAIGELDAASPAAPATSTGPLSQDAAERRQVTVMFSGLVGSTALSARMEPEDLRAVISAYQKCVAATVGHFGGFVAKYMGDGVLVYFGYPQAHENDAEQAVRAGLELIAAVTGLKTRAALQTRIGIATGLVVVGDLIGSGAAQEQAIVGETPNLAARLQALAEPNMVVIAEGTRRLLGNLFELEDLGARDLKGDAGPVRAWAALRTSSAEGRFDARDLITLLGSAAVIVALAIVRGGFYWQSHQQKQTLTEIAALVDKYSLATPAQAAVPGAKQSLTQAITAIAEGAASDPRYAQALALLKAGKPNEAEPLLKAVAEDKEKRADKDAKDAAAAYRNLASIAALSDPGRAREYYAQAARLDPSDVSGMFQNGWFQEQAGQLDAARAAYARVIAAAKPGADDEALVWAKFGMGDIAQQRGNLGAAGATYHEAETIADRLAKSDPGNAGWQRDLSVSYNKVGDVQVAQGNLPAALASYQAGLAIRDRLAKSDPGNAGWQRDLSVSYNKVGDVQVAQGNLPAALASYQASLAISDRLAKSDPGNAGWQRDLSVSYDKVGDVQVAQGNLPAR